MKKMWKHFWTLTKRQTAGFTLVELIVVIAILAILAGVAVPAYSGYVTKANKQADITLISEIEHALTLAGYNGTFTDGEGGYIVLSTDGAVEGVEAGSNLEKALIATFGTGYADMLKLKYDGWGDNGLLLGLFDAQAVYESSYYDVSDQLMGQVKEITDAAWNILGNDGETTRAGMLEMFDGDLKLNDVAQMYGYDSFADVPDEALPNLMVLAVAEDITYGIESSHNPSKASGIIQNFALYNAYASTAAGKTEGADGTSFADAYATFIEEIEDPDADYATVAAAYNELKDAAEEDDTGFGTYAASQGQTDFEAFSAMMSGLMGAAWSNNSEIAEGLTQDDFYTNGFGGELFNTYINSVEAAVSIDLAMWEAIDLALMDNKHAVFYSMANNKISVGNTLLAE